MPDDREEVLEAMKSVVKYAPGVGQVGLRDMPEPEPGPHEVKIAIHAAGICGTDIHIYDGEYANRPPVILGHECSGHVIEVGDDVSGISVGDRVTALPFAVTCGTCPYCHQGQLALCPERLSFGSGVNGAFAPYLVVPASIVRRLPDNLDYEGGALSEPVACCVKGVLENSTIRPGDKVLVTGPGPIGLIALQIAKAYGARVALVGTAADEGRLVLGQDLGADLLLRAEDEDCAETVRQWTEGLGVDVALECAGVPSATRLALQLVRKQGQITQMGLHGKPFELDFEQVVYKDVRVTGSFASSVTAWDRALLLLREGLVQVKPLIGGILPLEEWERGFDMVRRKEGLKILLRPSDV